MKYYDEECTLGPKNIVCNAKFWACTLYWDNNLTLSFKIGLFILSSGV
jgi:hypothetical protein